MSDEPGVTVPPSDPTTPPSLEDIADVLARTNRGLLAVEKSLLNIMTWTAYAFGVLLAVLIIALRRPRMVSA